MTMETPSTSENSSISNNSISNSVENEKRRNCIASALPGFYCLCATMIALVIELSHLLRNDAHYAIHEKDAVLSIYMYGVGLIFLAMVYCYQLPKNIKRFVDRILRMPGAIYDNTTTQSVGTNATDALSDNFFLQLACIAFGTFGMLYYLLVSFYCIVRRQRAVFENIADILAVFFTCAQMHFIIFRRQTSYKKFVIIFRIGLMHLIAVNLWIWIRYTLVDQTNLTHEISGIFNHNATKFRLCAKITEFTNSTKADGNLNLDKLAQIMQVGLLEYSLICAAMNFVLYRKHKIASASSSSVDSNARRPTASVVGAVFANTESGFFFGLINLLFVLATLVIFHVYVASENNRSAAIVHLLAELFQNTLTTIVCGTALWLSRSLLCRSTRPSHLNDEAQLLNKILIAIGIAGEILYSVAAIIGLSDGEKLGDGRPILLMIVHSIRLIQSVMQASLIYGLLSVHAVAQRMSRLTKQLIVFLLVANFAIFVSLISYRLEEESIRAKRIADMYGGREWVLFIRSCFPLVVLFRSNSVSWFSEILLKIDS